ncbi:histone deacetylase HOS3 [Capronia epimyces CBS 606.96]|uniref:Histone deacetylase HOS3 n=1 Tax=Capronia epimyces CBS 606.96 TaxID=1182542 RepID=W9ZEB2_9EURO|nr:histone deacetylase HOS3 [Capronia epimyces CBS 606.96]EXJ92829.1 histone deacetylase HOS3 [Capronia epimyces CBS 606.96]
MDPDIPAPSVEGDDALPKNNDAPTINAINTTTAAASAAAVTPALASPAMHLNHYSSSHLKSAAAVPLPPSSPMRSPHQTAAPSATKSISPKPPSRSPSVASSYRGDRQSTPTLVTRRSTSSLSVSKGGTPQKPQYRRASSNLNPSSPAANGKMAFPMIQERPPVTASSVAREYFGVELEAHGSLHSPVVVIVHDSCYGHRFSRPRASKNALATIVERPERIHATLLGASAAYVRLGGRHADGRNAPRPKHDSLKVRDVPFQIRKTSRTIPLSHPSVAFVHGSKWMEELQIMCDMAEDKLTLNGKELVRPIGYGKDEAGNTLPKLHEGDLYLCAGSLAAFQGCLGGVCDAVDTVFSSSTTYRAFVCIRPPGHHCSSNYPSGFCWLNNVHVGIAYAAMNHGLTHAAIIDFDLHHGDGSQNIAWDQNRKAQNAARNAAAYKKTPIGYYSLHDINSYPCEWGDEEKVRNASLCIENAHGQSIWNVHLEPWKTDQEFWKLYETKYAILLEKARIFLRSHTAKLRASGHQQPKAAIFVSAGFDASEWEGAGMQRHSVNVPTDFYARFTADIVKLSHENGLGVDGRVISVLEGGYSDRALTSGVFSHMCGLAGDTVAGDTETFSMLDASEVQTINNWVPQDITASVGNVSYVPEWWAEQNLEELEAIVAGHQPPGAKSSRDKTANYSSPTQASTLKMTDHARERRSLAALQARLSLESEYEPPPPDVDWATASYELSRVIIPGDRQTLSCTHEDLNAEATKARRERVSNSEASAVPEERMQLRGRRPKAPPAGLPGARVASRNGNRRTTIAAVSDLPDPSLQQYEQGQSRPRRRSSDASSILSSFQGMKISEEGVDNWANPSMTRAGNAPSRTPSVAPEKPTKAVAVKKTRIVPTTKGPAKTKTSPRKPKATPPAVSGAAAAAKAGVPVSAGQMKLEAGRGLREASTPSQGRSTAASTADEMDSLTSGVNKISIKLKVPSPEEHAARQQQKMLEDKQKKPRAPRKPVLPKPARVIKADPPGNNDQFVPIQPKPVQNETSRATPPTSKVTPGVNVDETSHETGPSHHGNQATEHQLYTSLPSTQLPSQAPVTVNNGPQIQDAADPAPVAIVASDNVLPFSASTIHSITNQSQSTGHQTPQIDSDPALSKPTSARPSTPIQRTKQDLPVFTSQSPIPFAAPRGSDTITVKEDHDANHGPSGWGVPNSK